MKKYIYALFCLILAISCTAPAEKKEEDLNTKSWEEITQLAKGQTVNLMMWQGDPLINRYMKEYVVPEIKKQYEVNLNISGGQGSNIVSILMAEIEAGKTSSEVDMSWINGETFFQLRQIKALYGPFVNKLPNNEFINWQNPFIAIDFQQTVEGYECPWGNVQLALIYNSEKVQTPPMNLEELENWVKANPGKFTISNEFTGMTLLKSWLIHLAGGKGSLDGKFDEDKYKKYSAILWDYLRRIKPYLWNEGKSFPSEVAQMHQLFANGELLFTMSNNDGEVDNKILQGIFPKTSRAYVLNTGTIQNSHYMGIVNHSANKAGALVVCNFLISPEAQWKKMQPAVWGDHTILAIEKLPQEWQTKFDTIPDRTFSPKREQIQEYALTEPAPEYMMRLFEDFRKEVMEK